MPHRPTTLCFRLALRMTVAAVLLPLLAVLAVWTPAAAVDHREAPLIMLDPVADVTDTYAFVFRPDEDVSPIGVLAMIPEELDQPTWGDTSLLLELGNDIPDPLPGPFTVPVELTRLGLRSSVPIVVTNPDGTTEQWDVELGVSSTTATTGTLNLLPGGSNFGSFSIELQFYPRVIFTSRVDGEVRTFDYGMQTGGTIPLSGSGNFSLACPPNRLTIPGVTTPFCLGHDFQSGSVFPVTLSDSDNPSNPRFSARVEPTPAPSNNPPVLNPIGNMTINEGQSLGRTFGSSDPDGDARTFSVDGLPAFCTLTDRGDGIAIFACSPGVGDAGAYGITVTVLDGRGGSDSETFTLTVVGQGNQPPELTPIGDRTAKEFTSTMSFISASDPDGDLITVGSGDSLPSDCALGEVLGSGPGSWLGVIVCDPKVKAGVYSPTVTAMDGRGGSDSETFTLTVLPALDAGADRTVAQGTPVELTATSPNPNLTYSWDINNDGFFDNGFGASVLFETVGLTPGTYPITVQGCAPDTGAGTVCDTDVVDVTVRNAWTYDELRRLTREYVDNPFVERGLVALVNLAEAFAGRGLHVFANGTLDLYIRTIQAATPRFVTAQEAQELLEIAESLKQ